MASRWLVLLLKNKRLSLRMGFAVLERVRVEFNWASRG
jgi:hypothetical protein